MTAPAAQTTLRTPGEREPIPGGREPISSGAPPGAPPEGAPFHSALETEWARTAIAEGQQQRHSESPFPASSRTPAHGAGGAESGASSTRTPAHGAGEAGACASSSVSPPPSASGAAIAGAAAGAAAAPAAHDPTDVPGTPAARGAGEGASGSPTATGLEGSYADTRGAVPSAPPGAPSAGASTPIADSRALPPAGNATAPDPHSISDDTPTAADDRGTSTSGGTPTAADDRGTTGGEGIAAPASDGATARGRVGADPGWASSDPPAAHGWLGSDSRGLGSGSRAVGSDASQASPRPSGTSAASATLGSPAHKEGAGGGSWSSQAGVRAPAKQAPPWAAGAGAHDKLWVPDPAQAHTGVAADTGGVAAGGVGGLAGGAGSAQVSPPTGGDQQGPMLEDGVGLQQAIETLHGTIQLAARQGLSQARIALEPEGLGEIRINLTQTSQGLLARVTAETPVAAQALAAAHAELRQSLSSLGLNLARLSIGAHSHSAAHDGDTALGGGRGGATGGGEAFSGGARAGQSAARGPTAPPTDPGPDIEAEEHAQPATASSRGALLDVLA